LRQVLNPADPACIAAFFLLLLYPVHCPSRGVASFVQHFARSDLMLDSLFEMTLKFFVQFPFHFASTENGTQSMRNRVEPMLQAHALVSLQEQPGDSPALLLVTENNIHCVDSVSKN
jgi:hypothetical protein